MNAHVKKLLEASLRGLVALSIFAAFAVTAARAQNREEHFISARAGGVNFVSGDVKARRADEADWQRLTMKEDLKTGDAVRTGADGRVEVLLNPGSYFRAGEASEFEMVDASLDNLRLRLARGSAVVEAVGYDQLGLDIAVATPQAHVHIVRTGVYRFRVTPEGVTEVAVYKGRVLIGDGEGAGVTKGGHVVRIGAGGVETAKLDKHDRDTLDLWSRDRGKELAKLNEKLASRQMNSMLARSRAGIFSQGFSFGGVWAFSASFGCYTFLPFYYGWSSPYGYGYNSWLYTPRAYPGTYGGGTYGQGGHPPGGGYPPPPGNPGNTGNGGNGNGSYPGGFNGRTPSPPPTAEPPMRDIPHRDDPGRPMPERTIQPAPPK